MRTTLISLTIAAFGLTACKSGGGAQPGGASSQPAAAPAAAPAPITITLEAKSESSLSGTATFTDTGSGVDVVIELSGVPAGKHGAHIHETPDCSAADGKSAGGHYNPHGVDHALPSGGGHLGDLGNIEIGEDGTGRLAISMPQANLKAGDANSFRDRAVIIHADADDGGQPTGNAGGRIGCGVIQ